MAQGGTDYKKWSRFEAAQSDEEEDELTKKNKVSKRYKI